MKTAIQELKAISLEQNRRKYPHLPEAVRVPYPYNDRDANGLTRCIIDYIRFMGFQAERISVVGRVIDNRKVYTDVLGHTRTIGGYRWIKPSMQPGTADISATIQSISVKIEVKCKATNDRQSEAQKQYQAEVENAGGLYVIATDFEQFYNWYQKEFNHE
jgi:hypothetical protein